MKFDAFISYRHLPLDMHVAKKLHTTLESFSLPKNVRKEGQKNKITRIFRDQDELPLSPNLAEPIDQALRESEYLIVICTPQLKESRWCRKEIETFIKLNGREKILAVLAEGEPDESFPPELLSREIVYTDEYGNVVRKLEKCEPLAADVRGNSTKEIDKKIKSESLRILAPMFGVDYDTLKQRHRERALKRLIKISSAVAAVFLIFGIISTFFAIKINSQSNEIKKNYALSLSEDALTALTKGNPDLALSKAQEAVDIGDNAISRFALTKATGKYEAEGILAPASVIPIDSNLMSLNETSNGRYIYGITNALSIILYDTQNEIYKQIDDIGQIYLTNSSIVFLDDDRFVVSTDNHTILYTISSGEYSELYDMAGNPYMADGSDILYLLLDGYLYAADSTSMNTLFCAEANVDAFSQICLSSDGQKLLVARTNAETNQSSLSLIDAGSGKVLSSTNLEDYYVSSICACEDGFFLNMYAKKDSDNYCSRLAKFDTKQQKISWESKVFDFLFYNISYCSSNGNSYLVASQSDSIFTFDAAKGDEPIFSQTFDSFVCTKPTPVNGDQYLVLSSKGILYCYSASSGQLDTLNCINYAPSLQIMNAILSTEDCYVWYDGADYISHYKPNHQDANEYVGEFGEYNPATSQDYMSFSTTTYDHMVYNENIPDSELLALSYTTNSFSLDQFVCYNYSKDEIRMYDKSGKFVGEIPCKTRYLQLVCFSMDDKYLLLSYQNDIVELYDTKTLELVATIDGVDFCITPLFPTRDGGYGVDCVDGTYFFNSSFEKIVSFPKHSADFFDCIGYDRKNGKYIVRSGDKVFAICE